MALLYNCYGSPIIFWQSDFYYCCYDILNMWLHLKVHGGYLSSNHISVLKSTGRSGGEIKLHHPLYDTSFYTCNYK